MASSPYKFYHQGGFDSRTFLHTYVTSGDAAGLAEEFLKFPMEQLFKVFASGKIKGQTLTDISVGPIIHHLYTACEFFRDIFLLRLNERCILELNRWLHDRTGAHDWSYTAPIIKEHEGECVQHEEKEMKLKSAIKHVLKCDTKKENLIDPLVLPQADCLITICLLNVISKDKEEYTKNLRKFLKFLKPEGNLILAETLGATYYIVGNEKLQIFTTNESFIRETLAAEGFIIDQYENLESKTESEIVDHKSVLFLTAHRAPQI